MFDVSQTPPRYLQKVVDEELEELASSLLALAIVGAKGVGKTATASRRATTVNASTILLNAALLRLTLRDCGLRPTGPDRRVAARARVLGPRAPCR